MMKKEKNYLFALLALGWLFVVIGCQLNGDLAEGLSATGRAVS